MKAKAVAKKFSLSGKYVTEDVIIMEMSWKGMQITLETVRFDLERLIMPNCP